MSLTPRDANGICVAARIATCPTESNRILPPVLETAQDVLICEEALHGGMSEPAEQPVEAGSARADANQRPHFVHREAGSLEQLARVEEGEPAQVACGRKTPWSRRGQVPRTPSCQNVSKKRTLGSETTTAPPGSKQVHGPAERRPRVVEVLEHVRGPPRSRKRPRSPGRLTGRRPPRRGRAASAPEAARAGVQLDPDDLRCAHRP